MKSKYVCARCGVSVGRWYFGWKHQSGWHGPKSCGKPPEVITREAYEKRKEK